MTDQEFMVLVEKGIDALPARVLDILDNIAVVIADEATRAQRKANNLSEQETLFGLYEGVPKTLRGIEPIPFPDKITIFKKPILEAYSDPNDVAECVSNTVWHEIAHHFGYEEEWIEREERRRGKMR